MNFNSARPDIILQLASLLSNLADQPSIEILDGLRDLERKTGLVFTTLKASVYSMVLQQEMQDTSLEQ